MQFTRMYFSDFLVERKGLFEPDDERIQELTKIEKIDFSEGKLHLGKYKPTKTKQLIVEPNDFVFSGLNIEKGAVSLNLTGLRLVVSANYSTCKINFNVIDKEFLSYLIRSQYFKSMLIAHLKKDYGFTRPKHLMPLSFFAPSSIEDQRQIVEQLKRTEVEGLELKSELTRQQALLKKLRQQILQEAIEGKLTADWRVQTPDVEPASELLKRITAEKAQLVKDKKIKLGKKQPASEYYDGEITIPDEWVRPDLDDITQYITDGTHQTPNYTTAGRIFLSAQNVKPFRFMPENHRFVSESDYQDYIKNRNVEKGDLLLGRVGAGIGETAVVDVDIECAIYVSLGLVKTFKQYTSPDYLAIVFNSPYGIKYAKGNVSSGGGSAGNFNLGRIRSFSIPFPSIDEQEAIVTKVEKLLAFCDQLETQISQNQAHAEKLMQAVLKEAFCHNSEVEPKAKKSQISADTPETIRA